MISIYMYLRSHLCSSFIMFWPRVVSDCSDDSSSSSSSTHDLVLLLHPPDPSASSAPSTFPPPFRSHSPCIITHNLSRSRSPPPSSHTPRPSSTPHLASSSTPHLATQHAKAFWHSTHHATPHLASSSTSRPSSTPSSSSASKPTPIPFNTLLASHPRLQWMRKTSTNQTNPPRRPIIKFFPPRMFPPKPRPMGLSIKFPSKLRPHSHPPIKAIPHRPPHKTLHFKPKPHLPPRRPALPVPAPSQKTPRPSSPPPSRIPTSPDPATSQIPSTPIAIHGDAIHTPFRPPLRCLPRPPTVPIPTRHLQTSPPSATCPATLSAASHPPHWFLHHLRSTSEQVAKKDSNKNI